MNADKIQWHLSKKQIKNYKMYNNYQNFNITAQWVYQKQMNMPVIEINTATIMLLYIAAKVTYRNIQKHTTVVSFN
jgi:hypothetical protein